MAELVPQITLESTDPGNRRRHSLNSQFEGPPGSQPRIGSIDHLTLQVSAGDEDSTNLKVRQNVRIQR